MKKRFTLMLIAAIVAVTSFAQDVKQRQIAPSQMVTKTLQATPSIKPFHAISKAQVAKTTALKAKKAPKKAGLTDVEWPLTALACGYAYVLDDSYNLVDADVPYLAAETTINMVDLGTTVSVTGLYPGADQAVTATLNLSELSFEIAPGQTLMTTEYGSVILTNVEDPTAPLTGQFNEDATVSINELWCGVLGDDAGDNAGRMYTDIYYTPLIAQPNGHMDFTDSEGAHSVPVYVYQDPARGQAMVFNFAGEASGVIVNVAEDGTIVIKSQPVSDYTSWGYGVFDTYAADADGATTENITGVVEGSVLTFDTGWSMVYWTSSDRYVWFGLMSETTITLDDEEVWEVPVIEDVPAMPADPEVVRINPYNAESGYGSVVVHIPNVDIDGFLLKESKLYYRIYGQKDGEVTLLEFTPDLYQYVTETMSTIPYTFDDAWDFQTRGENKYVFLNFDFDYDTMGVQSVYYGGDEENATEIIWYVEEPSELTEAQWVAAEQGYENTQEVTDIVISEEDGITGVFAQAEGSNPPKYYESRTSVTMFESNTLTITSAEYPINKIELILGTRTDIELASEDGEFSVEEGSDNKIATWEGEANEVVFDVPQGLSPKGQAYILGINVYYIGEEKEPELIELPDGAEVQAWHFDGYTKNEDEETGETYMELTVSSQIHVAFVGDQVYFQGLNPDTEDSWVVGTLADGVITVPADEYMGYSTYYYNADYLVDVFSREMTMTYDEEKQLITSASICFDYIYSESVINSIAFDYAEIYPVKEIPGKPATPEVVDVNLYDTIYPWITLDIPTTTVDGNEMILDNVFYMISIMDKDGEMFDYVFKADNYAYLDEDLTQIAYNYSDNYDIYKGGSTVYVFDEDFTRWQQIWVQTAYYTDGNVYFSEYGIYDLTEYWETVGINDVAAKDVKSVKYFDLQGRQIPADAKGVVIAVKQMSDGTTKTTKMLRK